MWYDLDKVRLTTDLIWVRLISLIQSLSFFMKGLKYPMIYLMDVNLHFISIEDAHLRL